MTNTSNNTSSLEAEATKLLAQHGFQWNGQPKERQTDDDLNRLREQSQFEQEMRNLHPKQWLRLAA